MKRPKPCPSRRRSRSWWSTARASTGRAQHLQSKFARARPPLATAAIGLTRRVSDYARRPRCATRPARSPQGLTVGQYLGTVERGRGGERRGGQLGTEEVWSGDVLVVVGRDYPKSARAGVGAGALDRLAHRASRHRVSTGLGSAPRRPRHRRPRPRSRRSRLPIRYVPVSRTPHLCSSAARPRPRKLDPRRASAPRAGAAPETGRSAPVWCSAPP